MGQSSVTLTTSAVNNRVAASYPLESKTLVALTAKCTEISIRPCYIYARIGLSVDGDAVPNIVATLAEGYIGSGISLSWTGAIPLSQNMRIIIETWGRTATTVSLDAITV